MALFSDIIRTCKDTISRFASRHNYYGYGNIPSGQI
jgi:hypothetical protein